jgi:hypothetical protein
VLAPDHPVCAGLPATFDLHDELYLIPPVAPGVTPQTQARNSSAKDPTNYAPRLCLRPPRGTLFRMRMHLLRRPPAHPAPTGGGLRVGGSGFSPDGYVDVFLDPPTTSRMAYAIARLLPRASFSLGRVSVDADGAVTGSIQLPADAPAGSRVLQIVGRTSDDRALVLSPAWVACFDSRRLNAFHRGGTLHLVLGDRAPAIERAHAELVDR